MTAFSIFARSDHDLGTDDKQSSLDDTGMSWIGYDELAEITGLARESLISIARRQGWPRRPGNRRRAVQFAVPSDLLEECRVARAGGTQAAIPWGRLAADPAADVTVVLGSICRKFESLERRENRLEGYLRQQLERECRRADRAECAVASSQDQLATAMREIETLQAAIVLARTVSDAALGEAQQQILLLNGAIDAERAQAVLAAEVIAAGCEELVAEQARFATTLADERRCTEASIQSLTLAADAAGIAATLELAAVRATLAHADQHVAFLRATADGEAAVLRAMLAAEQACSEQARCLVIESAAERERLEAAFAQQRENAASQLQEVVNAANVARTLFAEDRARVDAALAEAQDTIRALQATAAAWEQRAEDAERRAEESAGLRMAAAVAEERERTAAATVAAAAAETRGDRVAGQLQLEKVRANEAEARLAKLELEAATRASTPRGVLAWVPEDWLGHIRRILPVAR